MSCSWALNDLFTTCLCLAHNLFIHNLFKLFLWFVHELFITCSKLVHYLFTTCLHFFVTRSWEAHQLLMTCLQLVYDLFTTCSLLVHDLFTTCCSAWIKLNPKLGLDHHPTTPPPHPTPPQTFQLLLDELGRILGPCLKSANCYGDICPN